MRILVVDGVADAAENLEKSLLSLGWPAVGSATNSDEAVEWINDHGGCDVLVTEVFLQPADGFALRETIQPHLPDMKTIFTSAHDLSAHADRMAGCPSLCAPVNAAALDALIRHLTATPPQTSAPVAPEAPSAALQPTAQPTPRPVAAQPAAAQPTPRPVAAQP
ncbi:MAG: response regulator, partial [Verrucomicrobiae bacterium]